MYKQWGRKTLPICREYENMIIRWGREEVVGAVTKDNKRNNDDDDDGYEFLY
jgi:hypothetical protein